MPDPPEDKNAAAFNQLCDLLAKELQIALSQGEVGKIGVTADIKGGRIMRIRRVIDSAQDNS